MDSPAKNKKMQKQQKGDFIFKLDDMLAVLFPHMYEEIEFLLPEEAGVVVQPRHSAQNEDVEMVDAMTLGGGVVMDFNEHSPARHREGNQNAVAGPSRPRGG